MAQLAAAMPVDVMAVNLGLNNQGFRVNDQGAGRGGREADLLVAQLAAAMPVDVMAVN